MVKKRKSIFMLVRNEKVETIFLHAKFVICPFECVLGKVA